MAKQDDKDIKAQIKRDFPVCTGIVDEHRAVFGPAVKVTYMKEGGREMGRKSEDIGVPVSVMNLAPLATAPEKPRAPSRKRWKDLL